MSFGPKNEEEEIIFAAEGMRVDVQHRISTLMNERGVSGRDLALRMHVEGAFVDRIFDDETDLTVRDLGRIIHALGVSVSEFVRPWVQRDSEIARLAADVAEAQHRLDLLAERVAAASISAGTNDYLSLGFTAVVRPEEPEPDTALSFNPTIIDPIRRPIKTVTRVERTEISLPDEDED